MSLNYDGLAIIVGVVGHVTIVLDLDGDVGLLLARLDEVLETAGAICLSSFDTQADGESSEDGTLSTAVVTDDEVDQWTELDAELAVTHEVFHVDFFDDALFGCPILFVSLVVALDKLSSADLAFGILAFVRRNIKMEIVVLVDMAVVLVGVISVDFVGLERSLCGTAEKSRRRRRRDRIVACSPWWIMAPSAGRERLTSPRWAQWLPDAR
ncbi:DNA repair protein Rad18, partial [Aureobasidium melanogenum]